MRSRSSSLRDDNVLERTPICKYLSSLIGNRIVFWSLIANIKSGQTTEFHPENSAFVSASLVLRY